LKSSNPCLAAASTSFPVNTIKESIRRRDVVFTARHDIIGRNGARLSIQLQGLAAEQTAYPSDAIEMALAHTIANKVEAAYAAAIYLRSANG